MTYQEQVLKWALEYAARGWAVIPLHSVTEDGGCTCGNVACTDIGKHPATKHGLKDGSKDPVQIQQWFGSDAALRNVGIVTGEISNLTVLDIDVGAGKCGMDTWLDVNAEHGEPDTLKAQTGSGGFHALFLYNSALKTASNVLGKGIDCRCDRGYVVASPSRHRSGRAYEWLNWGTPLCALPAHLSKKKETRGRPHKDDPYHGFYTIEQVRGMLEKVPADDRDLWRNVGIVLGRQFRRADKAWTLYVEWAAKWDGQKGRGHDEIMYQCFYELSQQTAERELSMGTIIRVALDHGWVPTKGDVPKEDFVYYVFGNNFIYRQTGDECIAAALDVAVSPVNIEGKLMKASEWIKAHQLVTSLTCDPALKEDYVKGFNCRNGEVIAAPGAAIFNTYRWPTIELGDAKLAGPWREHVAKMMDKAGDADQFLDYMAHRVQFPGVKPRFALLLAGGQGIGKDTAVEMCQPAIGVWNVENIEPSAFDTAYNEYAAATLVRINEAANQHDISKWAFNERTKVLIAGTPDVVRVNPKYGEQFSMRMYCGVVITTNNLATGIYLPPDDRRYDVIACATLEEMKLADESLRREYFAGLWGWFLMEGGAGHIAAFLHERDLSKFSASQGQRKTAAHQEVVALNVRGDEWLDDVLDGWGYPSCVRSDWVVLRAVNDGEKKEDVYRRFDTAMDRAGYTKYPNPERPKDGRWRTSLGVLVRVYRRKNLALPKEDLVALLNPVDPVK